MYNKLKKENLEARKAKNTVKSNLLGTVIGEAQTIGKNAGNRDPNDEEVMGVVKKFIKSLDEAAAALEKAGRDFSKEKEERSILEAYLPAQLNEEQLKKTVAEIVQTLSDKSPRMMGQVMSILKEKYPNQFDGKMASAVVKQALGQAASPESSSLQI
ncbi:MAG: GatB/YqeY domain-containing protein [Spirochaetia bacterium]|nr:GatB/YqeY domain-containing protein [Spirochaetia bacterium]